VQHQGLQVGEAGSEIIQKVRNLIVRWQAETIGG
jgi:hypothetical protein